LVVNEAMACGLPILISRKCGCQPELCWRGLNGYDFDPLDVSELVGLMARVSGGELDLEAMGEASRQIIAPLTPDGWARVLLDCIETVRVC
jgi:glycosyltransferase involved in cell wall biosynthesis